MLSRATAIIKLISILTAVSLARFAYVDAILPLYGSVPTEANLNKVALVAILTATMAPTPAFTKSAMLITSILLSAAPTATYWVAVFTSRMRSPVWGPVITHSTVLAPITYFLAISAVKTRKDLLKDTKYLPYPIFELLVTVSFFYSSNPNLYGILSGLTQQLNVSGDDIYLVLAGSTLTAWVASLTMKPSPQKRLKNKRPPTAASQAKRYTSLAFLPIWLIASSTLFRSPALKHPLRQPYRHPTLPLQIYSSVRSKTGLILVGEILPPPGYSGSQDHSMHSVRYLRASHSILGGVWMGGKAVTIDGSPAAVDSHGTPLGDSIYSTFVLQEAVRLVNSTSRGKARTWENALIIGLGTGISASAFNRHGISTTIVEIDPAVYDAARKYFGLRDPGPGKVFLEDARKWVLQRRRQIEAGRGNDVPEKAGTLFDIVVHDCFSGGGVPEHIFTTQFWEDLKAIMHPEGVIVVNFAGELTSKASRAILLTLELSFGQCRAFHDSMEPISEEQYSHEFINMVLFCSPSTEPLTFRRSGKSDHLNSHLRRHVFSTLPEREINTTILRMKRADDESDLILTDDHNSLGKWQEDQAHLHWTLMRGIMADAYWETF